MTAIKMKNILIDRLQDPERSFQYDKEKDTLRIVNDKTGKGITITLSGIIANWETGKEKAIDEVVYYVNEGLSVMGEAHSLQGNEKKILPVIRSASFPQDSREGVPFLFDSHTAETRIYYALDLGKTYRLIDEQLIQKEGWEKERIREIARFNVRSLSVSLKEDRVAGNIFYFMNTNDGYDASRILNTAWLDTLKSKITGTMALAVPHQDVVIIADIQNQTGYDILAQMAMSFFASGHVPITALSFLYEDSELEPIFILGKNRPKENNTNT
ncbi:DUF1444 domain-containing protein [Peribacillus deserti]|uniref:UPF0354 protein CUU66_02215 n=1 Tax=Peribacillus deserti TaxID=673318 RepID=A0A2N5MAX2_9BACI|nr:DUF1444 domain-containing protein [Peribacillus deserti]PLT31500.1 DUF1444 domain-containing protein [Peribacillus deserti]